MAEGEDAAEVSLSVRNEEDVSPESLAWADSCINSFPDDSDNSSSNWGTFRDALTEIIDIHPDMFVPASTSFLSPDEDMTEPEADSANSKNSSAVENSTTGDEGVERIEEDGSVGNGKAEEEERELVSSQVVFKDDFMSTYIQDNVDDFNVTEDPVKVTPQEIFKVWDLDIVGDEDEEGGLVLQLKKALDDSSTVQPLPQPLNDGDQVAAEKRIIDDLINGISDLSLAEAETFK